MKYLAQRFLTVIIELGALFISCGIVENLIFGAGYPGTSYLACTRYVTLGKLLNHSNYKKEKSYCLPCRMVQKTK